MSRLLVLTCLCLGWALPSQADFRLCLARTAAITTTGSQTITGACAGQTPTAAILWATSAVSDATAADHARFSIGYTDCTNQAVTTISDRHGVTAMEGDARYMTDAVVALLTPADGTVEGEASVVGCVADGLEITWGNAVDSAYLLQAVFFVGSDLEQAHVGTFTNNATVNLTTDVTTVGFQPTDIFLAGVNATTVDSTRAQPYFTFGVFSDLATDYQGSQGWFEKDNADTTAQTGSVASAQYAAWHTQHLALIHAIEIGGLDSQGFTATTRESSVDSDWIFLALKFSSGVSRWAGAISTPTTTGADSQTGAGFEPGGVLLWQGLNDVRETLENSSSDSGSLGFAAFTSANAYSCAASIDDGVSTSKTQSLCDDAAVHLPQDDGTAGLVAAFTSFDANGWTLNYTTTAFANAKQWTAWAVETVVDQRASPLMLLLGQ